MSYYLGHLKTHRKHIKNNTWDVTVVTLHLERSTDMVMRFYLNYLAYSSSLIPGYDISCLFDIKEYYRDGYETS